MTVSVDQPDAAIFRPRTDSAGEFQRVESTFRNWVTVDGAPGLSGVGGFRAEPGRYHLYVSYACPWAHRTLILRKLKKLEGVISVDVVHPHMTARSWHFDPSFPGATADTVNGATFLEEVYRIAEPGFAGLVTVPVLWDKQRRTIVNNESAEIIRMLNSAFDAWGDAAVDCYPEPLRQEIDELNAWIYRDINNGVYRAGFAATQGAYERGYERLFAALDELETRLTRQPFLLGEQPTEADWRLFPTLVRFDPVYYSHFKCNRQRLVDFPALWRYTRRLYQWPGVAQTVFMDHIKTHYFTSHPTLNPSGIVPKGPELDFWLPV
ncbi:MAG TPA: glutathione S-transferase family protein [Candidatus Competibacteraceae bacterium]|nr:glutathione S-transferase family protein [Candidatus Competibacteraceae bacterium]